MRVLAYHKGGSFSILMLVALLVFSGRSVLADIDCITDASGCCCVGKVGNVDCDYTDLVDISDLTRLIDYLFISRAPLPNWAEANIDGSPGGVVDIADLTRFIDYFFISYAELPECQGDFNTPPRTHILIPEPEWRLTYINAVEPGNPATGIPVAWKGEDLVDHPYLFPGCEFEWRLYGPYPYNPASDGAWVPPDPDPTMDTTFEEIMDNFVKPVFRRADGHIYILGEGHSFLICDTIPVPFEVDPTGFVIECDTVLVDTFQVPDPVGIFDTILDVDDPLFRKDSRYDRIALRSWDGIDFWRPDTSEWLYDAFKHNPSDTTLKVKFIFWVRARDPLDSTLLDPTPAWIPVRVIEPKFERDIGVIDVQISFQVNSRNIDSARAYWKRAIHAWSVSSGSGVTYVDSVDYIVAATAFGFSVSLADLLSYKTLLIVNDQPFPGAMMNPPFALDVFTAVDVGVGIWLCGRAQAWGAEAMAPRFDVFGGLSDLYVDGFRQLFGVQNAVYSGWVWHILVHNLRIEDFVGAASANASLWPELTIDTAMLHQRYQWREYYPWIDTIGALPEVNYLVPTAQAEVMYTYKSLYDADHWLDDTLFNFQGHEVAIRHETTSSRTAFWLFTPYAFEGPEMQTTINDMLSWLYDPELAAPVMVPRYPEAGIQIDSETVGDAYWRRSGLFSTDVLRLIQPDGSTEGGQ
ncbi:MAG: hypothetical protein JSU65_10210 [Candidatus Zixiibacteriota bacterium]|nr:MAG: hypothetical protein JSU65_10210 [candidate division Zixibacteria bacterium]